MNRQSIDVLVGKGMLRSQVSTYVVSRRFPIQISYRDIYYTTTIGPIIDLNVYIRDYFILRTIFKS
jgi:hypothetical protein